MDVHSKFTEATSGERRILTGGTFNARDAGGYPTRDGGWLLERMLYRSDALSGLTSADIDEFHRLGIRTVIDLRDKREAEAAPDIIDRTAVRYERIPIFEDKLFERNLESFPTLLGQYRIIMDKHVRQLIAVLKVLVEEADKPLLIHCTAGKDRTGLIIALVHCVVDLDDELILKDFGASELILGDKFEAAVRDLYVRAGLPPKILGAAPRHAPPAYLARTLADMHVEYGSVSKFLLEQGFGATEQDNLRRHMKSSAVAAAV